MIKIDFDLKQFNQAMSDLEKRQLPFAIASALSKTAVEAKNEVIKEMKKVFKNPTPYTLGSVYTRPARKTNLEALVWLKDSGGKGIPATKYLWVQVFGGKRAQKRHESALTRAGLIPAGRGTVPASGARVNAYGNLPGSTYTSMLSYLKASRDEMQNRTKRSARKAGSRRAAWWMLKKNDQPVAIMRKQGKKSIPYMIVTSNLTYRKRFDFIAICKKVHAQRFNAIFGEELAKAIRTAK